MKVGPAEDLHSILQRIDGRGYKAYQDLRGCYRLGCFTITVAHVQSDPYAPPSRVHVQLPLADAGFSGAAEEVPSRCLALEDFLARSLARVLSQRPQRALVVDACRQEVLRRTVVRVRREGVEARLSVHLPAAGRRILGRQAETILLRQLPEVLAQALLRPALDGAALAAHQATVEDHAALVESLAEHEWVAFVAQGAILPRRAGHDDRPLEAQAETPVVAFEPPASLAAEVRLPHAGTIRGMAIPRGVTLLVGGGFHGKSTLLEAIARGIDPHVTGDGRERVAADPTTVKVRAEDGRAVTATDISPFIGDLPYGRSTRRFSTQNASGSTSQAANIIEALQVGARLLLLDEDTSATNFMIRDEPMRRLLRPGQEPITPFLDRVGSLHRDRGVSTILVVGGSGEYFRVADRVIQMDRYVPVDVTAEARAIAPSGEAVPEAFPAPAARGRFRLDRYRHAVGPKGARVKALGARRLLALREEVELGACEQLVCPAQARTLAEILTRLIEGRGGDPAWERLADGFDAGTLADLLDGFGADVLDRASRFARGDLAAVRPIEVLAMVNRLRALTVTNEPGADPGGPREGAAGARRAVRRG